MNDNSTLITILEQLQRLLHADNLALMLFNAVDKEEGLYLICGRVVGIDQQQMVMGDGTYDRTQADNTSFYIACVPLIADQRVIGTLHMHRSTRITQEDFELLVAMGNIAANVVSHQRWTKIERQQTFNMTLEGWVQALELRDHETRGHTRRVTEVTVELSRILGLPDDHLLHIRRGALLHDIGKLAIPDSILLKPGPLTDEEWQVMREHPRYAYEMLSPISFLQPALDIPYYHHEKWDGTGYPHGLKEEDIPLPARIFAIVDVWDALRFDRPYRKAWAEDDVRTHIQSLAGIHFDPDLVPIFLDYLDQYPSISA